MTQGHILNFSDESSMQPKSRWTGSKVRCIIHQHTEKKIRIFFVYFYLIFYNFFITYIFQYISVYGTFVT